MRSSAGALQKEPVERASLCGLLGCPRCANRVFIRLSCLRGLLNLAKVIVVDRLGGGCGSRETLSGTERTEAVRRT